MRNLPNPLSRGEKEYSSADNVMSLEETKWLLRERHLMVEHVKYETAEVLR